MIRFLTMICASYLYLDVNSARKWIRKFLHKTSRPANLKKKCKTTVKCQEMKNEMTQRHMNSILHLCEDNMSHASQLSMQDQRANIPYAGWANTYAAMLLLLALLGITLRSFSASDSYSWYSLLMVASFCALQRLSAISSLYYLIREIQVVLLRLVPFRLISRLWGRMCDIGITPKLRPFLYKLYIKVYNVNIEEALDRDLTSYKTMGDFFRRQIDPQFRPIHFNAQVVSPSDGTVMQNGILSNGMVQQVKGVNYSVKKFFGTSFANADAGTSLQRYARSLMKNPKSNDLYSCVIYLAPGDYHRFHSPADWTMQHRRHFAGDLLSVNPFLVSLVPDLFVLNERVVLSGKWKHGFFSMTAVGATNVGSIVVYHDKNLLTNRPKSSNGTYFDHHFTGGGVSFSKGEPVGEFKLGSTIVLIYEAPKNSIITSAPRRPIKYGERLLV